MIKIKGCVQIIPREDESYKVYTYIDNPEATNLMVIYPNGDLNHTIWKKDQIAGTGNENFRPFHIWFEYDTSGDS